MTLPPIVPLADLVAELRAMHSIPCLTAADRLEEMDRETDRLDNDLAELRESLPARPLCPTCGGTGNTGRFPSSGYAGPQRMIDRPCPDCVDGHVAWQRLVALWADVWDDEATALIAADNDTTFYSVLRQIGTTQ